MSEQRVEPCVHANRARLEMVEQLHVAVFGSTWARPETPKQVWEMLLAKVRGTREFHDEVHSALQPGRWRGFDGPDGVSTHEVIADVAAALERFDQHTREPGP
jgi:hypothetical protein